MTPDTPNLTPEELEQIRKQQEEALKKALKKEVQEADFNLGRTVKHLRVPSL